jgi:hypothetical protein
MASVKTNVPQILPQIEYKAITIMKKSSVFKKPVDKMFQLNSLVSILVVVFLVGISEAKVDCSVRPASESCCDLYDMNDLASVQICRKKIGDPLGFLQRCVIFDFREIPCWLNLEPFFILSGLKLC